MRFILKFKDGITFEGNHADTLGTVVEGKQDFLSLLIKGKKDNSIIRLNDDVEKKFEDLYSIEIIL